MTVLTLVYDPMRVPVLIEENSMPVLREEYVTTRTPVLKMHAGTRPSRSFVLRCAYVGTRAGVCAGHARARYDCVCGTSSIGLCVCGMNSTGLRVWYNVVRHRALVCTGFEYDITLVATEEGTIPLLRYA